MLKIKNLRKTYDNFELNCSLHVDKGEIVGLVGANGAGKSTTFKSILRLIHIDDGDIELLGKKDLDINTRKKIGVILNDSTFQNFFTIRSAAKMMSYSYESFHIDNFLKECEDFNLPLDLPIKGFSTGMLAKFKLLISMSYESNFLILDEPTSGLDTVARNELLDKIREYVYSQPERGVLMSSHIGSDLKKICNRLYFIKEGKIIYEEKTIVLLNDYDIINCLKDLKDEKILFKSMKKDGSYSYIIKKNHNYQENIQHFSDIDDMIEIIMKGEKYE